MLGCAIRRQFAAVSHSHRFTFGNPILSRPIASSAPLTAAHLAPIALPPITQLPPDRFTQSRCRPPAVGQVATMITDMDFTTQAQPGLAIAFWESCKREAYASLYHPFVVSLAAGTLPKQAFQRYMAQDAYFLRAFKNGYQIAMESTEDEDAKTTLGSLIQAAQEELALHSSVMQSLGASDQKGFEPNKATVAYCDFLKFAATGSPSDGNQKLGIKSAKIIAAMTPCMRLYAFLGQEIKNHIKQVSDHPYQEWIDTYSGAEFETAASKVEQLLDKFSEPITTDKEKLTLYNLYRHAMNLEVDFFHAQPLGPAVQLPFFRSQPTPEKRLLLVADFDSTCTISDSCPVLADLSVQVAGKTTSGFKGESQGSLLRKKWEELVMLYMDEYEEVLARSLTNINHDNGNAAPTAEELQSFLKEMSDFEQRANARVEEAEVLKGLSAAAIRDAGSSMPLREGCSDFFKRLGSQEVQVDTRILSVCWSKTFIEAVLQQGEIHISNINANELVFDGASSSTGKLILNVETALDKQRHFAQISKEAAGAQQQVLSVYIGDSLTDLLCLVGADVGIVLGDSSTLKQVYGGRMSSLFRKALVLEQGNTEETQKLRGCVFTVSSWYEVEAFLLGPARARSAASAVPAMVSTGSIEC